VRGAQSKFFLLPRTRPRRPSGGTQPEEGNYAARDKRDASSFPFSTPPRGPTKTRSRPNRPVSSSRPLCSPRPCRIAKLVNAAGPFYGGESAKKW